jgi:hypothetical protein
METTKLGVTDSGLSRSDENPQEDTDEARED